MEWRVVSLLSFHVRLIVFGMKLAATLILLALGLHLIAYLAGEQDPWSFAWSTLANCCQQTVAGSGFAALHESGDVQVSRTPT
jgi:hypothetical protein